MPRIRQNTFSLTETVGTRSQVDAPGALRLPTAAKELSEAEEGSLKRACEHLVIHSGRIITYYLS